MPRASLILVVDDDADFRAVLREVLEGESCRVQEAADGKAALVALAAEIPDLVIIDLMMPVMNGWDLYAAMQHDPALVDVPVAIASGVVRMRPLGVMHELRKPFGLQGLMRLLRILGAPDRTSRPSRQIRAPRG
jgi:CheY-like chemotaxis protein